MARYAILLMLAIMAWCGALAAPAFPREIVGHESDNANWLLGAAAEDVTRWGFMELNPAGGEWSFLFDNLRVVAPREAQDPESGEPVVIKAEVLLLFARGRLELVLFDISDADYGYRKLARQLGDWYDGEDNTELLDNWDHHVWADEAGGAVSIARYRDRHGVVRSRVAWMTPAMAAMLGDADKPEWFDALLDNIEFRR